MVFALEPFHSVEAFGILTDHALFVFFMGYILQAVSVQGVIAFFVSSKVAYENLQVGGRLETYDGWAGNFCDIDRRIPMVLRCVICEPP